VLEVIGAPSRVQLVNRVYYESIKRELQRRLIYEYRCDERLKTKNEETKHFGHTGLVVELEHKDEVNRQEVGECEG
jgi:hypothetical protein